MTAEHIRSVLEATGFDFVEQTDLGRNGFQILQRSINDVTEIFKASDMILGLPAPNENLQLSLFAHSLRKNLARAISVPISDPESNRTNSFGSTLNLPIDVVYTWVDGEDPEWKEDYSDALARYGSTSPRTSSDMVRFRDREELKYSLRSIEMFAPWINHIYIVTNGQVPAWLDLNNPKISLVTHAEIFQNPSDLPTFNSHAIEANIHRIPGLNEHFLYFNDDVFLSDWCTPETFFTSTGKSKYFESDNRVPDDPSVTDLPSNWAAHNNKRLLEQKFGYLATKKFKHTAHAQRLSTLQKVAHHFGKYLEQTTRNKFRHRTDISVPSNLAHHFGAIVGTAVPGEIGYRYVDISSARVDVELSRLLLWDNPTIFCLNQVSSKATRDQSETDMIRNFLENYFPWKSQAEL